MKLRLNFPMKRYLKQKIRRTEAGPKRNDHVDCMPTNTTNTSSKMNFTMVQYNFFLLSQFRAYKMLTQNGVKISP
jgi:hypothetical protein